MSSKRQLLLSMAVIVVAAMLVGPTGASSVTADRGVDMSVATDQQAVVGFEQTTTQPDNGTTDIDVSLDNQFASGIELTTVEISVDGERVDLAARSPLEPGDRRTHTFVSVPCTEAISVHVSGAAVNSRFDRPVRC